MKEQESQVLFGNKLSEGYYKGVKIPYLFFQGSSYQNGQENENQVFAMDKESLFRHLLLLGSSGCGKTNVIKQIALQIVNKKEKDSVCIIFDTKADYIDAHGLFREGDYVLGTDKRFRSISDVWNVFDEIVADGEEKDDVEANAREIASVLFKDRGSKTQPFFANAARDILAGTFIYFIRKRSELPSTWASKLNNYDLFRFVMQATPEKYTQYFNRYPDLRGMQTYFGTGKNDQALGVFAELHSLMYDCFQGAFRKRADDGKSYFSVRKAVREKKGRNIFIEYDMSRGEILTPIYRLIVDLALKEALSQSNVQSNVQGSTYILLDELKLLPRIEHLEDALNYGRSKHVGVVAGLQNVSQLYSIYGHELGHVLLSGFGSLFAMKTNDAESREYVSRRFAPNITAYRYDNNSNEPIDRERSGYTVEQWQQMELLTGQSVIGLSSQATPFLYKFVYRE